MSNDTVAIMMGTYNGAEYIQPQLASLAAQTHKQWSLWISDDGSTDTTLELVKQFRQEQPCPVSVLMGPKCGFSRNFLSLLGNADIQAAYYGFADQDDIWYPEKLARAVDWLARQPQDKPALYCTRTHLVNNQGISLGCSPLFRKRPSFANALVQNLGGGNTMVMNHAARQILLGKTSDVDVVCHDWWVYIVLAGVGANIHYDARPSLDYRQHDNNLIGANRGLSARLLRIGMLAKGHMRDWNARHLHALRKMEHILTPANRQILVHFRQARERHLSARLLAYRRAGIYRQTGLGNLGLLAAVFLKRI